VIVSVTTLGARGRSAAVVAADVVGYLEGNHQMRRGGPEDKWRGGPRQGTRIELLSPGGGVVAYYADSAGDGPGSWWGKGAEALGLRGEVAGEDLYWTLQAKHHDTHETLLGARGSAGRAAASTASFDGRESYTLRELSEVVGVSRRYLSRLCEIGEQAAVLRVCELLAGTEVTEVPHTYLMGARDHRGTWRVPEAEARAFATGRTPPTVVSGFDLTFSVEKSVSALWAAAGDPVRSEILAGFDAAVDAGMSYMERHASFVRVGGTRVEAHGLSAASYLHATSRALDPQLHRHVVVANFATDALGNVRTLDSVSLYTHAKTAGYLAGAELRHQLTARLGVEWAPVVHGLSDVAGVPEAAIEALSTRRKDIDAAARAIGEDPQTGLLADSAAARQVLALQTRPPKRDPVDADELRVAWTEVLDGVGFTTEHREACLARVGGPKLVTEDDRRSLFEQLAGPGGMTQLKASFDRRDVLQEIASWSVDRLSARAIEVVSDVWLATPTVVALNHGRRIDSTSVVRRADGRVVTGRREPLYSTLDMVRVEARVTARYEAGRGAMRATAEPGHVEAILSLPRSGRLVDEQRALVRHMTSAGAEVGLVRGPAGTGKTLALEAATRVWEDAGYRVVGASVGGTAAERLGRTLGVRSSTVASLLARVGSGDESVIDGRTVVVVDEASTLGTRDLDALMGLVHEREAALWLVGDPAQHSAVTAGGAFRWLTERYPEDVVELRQVWRQVGPDMAEVRLALTEYREGQVRQALERLGRDERIVTAATADELLDELVADWYVDRRRSIEDPSYLPGSMTAARHDERRALVGRARVMLAGDGTLHGPEVAMAGMRFRAGDDVVAKVADRSLRPERRDRDSYIRNGTRGTVTQVADGHLIVDFERRGPVTVPRSYVEQEVAPGVVGGLLHAYALTTYAAQGDTYGAARHLGSDRSTRAEVYVGLTRGRHDTALYVVDRAAMSPPVIDENLPRLRQETDAARALAASVAAGGAERLAIELDPVVANADRLATVYEMRHLIQQMRDGENNAPETYARALELAARRVAAQAILDPDAKVLEVLGPRPEPGPVRAAWDRAVQAVAVYGEIYPCRPIDSLGPAGRLIGIRPSDHPGAYWDIAEEAIVHAHHQCVAARPEIEMVVVPQQVGVALDMAPEL